MHFESNTQFVASLMGCLWCKQIWWIALTDYFSFLKKKKKIQIQRQLCQIKYILTNDNFLLLLTKPVSDSLYPTRLQYGVTVWTEYIHVQLVLPLCHTGKPYQGMKCSHSAIVQIDHGGSNLLLDFMFATKAVCSYKRLILAFLFVNIPGWHR